MSIKKELFYECPRYSKCSINNCPLYPSYPDLFVHLEDKEQKCDLAKSIRVRIASNYPGTLKYEGMSPREYNAKVRWDNMSPEEQAAIKNRGKAALSLMRSEGIGVESPQHA